MANAIQWQSAPTSRGNVLSTELNSLADAARTDAGTEIDNSVNLDTYGCLEMNVTFGTAPGAGGYVALYIVTAPDGTNYSDGSSTVDPGADTLVLSIPVRAVTTAQRKITKWFPLPPCKLKFILRNESGQAFPASGSTVELFADNFELQ